MTKPFSNPATPVTPERAADIIDAYGAAPTRWPEAERAGVLRLAMADPMVRERLEEAKGLDRALDEINPLDAAPNALMERVLALAPRTVLPMRQLVVSLAACALFGVALGLGAGANVVAGAQADALLEAVSADSAALDFGSDS